jgi:ABC-type phosphate transport system permease subunit
MVEMLAMTGLWQITDDILSINDGLTSPAQTIKPIIFLQTTSCNIGTTVAVILWLHLTLVCLAFLMNHWVIRYVGKFDNRQSK